jgi:ADP-ribose pyrophosphatase
MPEPWKVLSQSLTYDDEWLRVRSDRCLTPSGGIAEPYHVLEYPDWVAVVPLTADGEIVLAREYRHAAGQVLTGLVSGGVAGGERPEEAARRELREETGFGGELHSLGWYWANPTTHTNRVWAYLILGAERVAETKLDRTEEIDVVRRPVGAYLRETLAGTGGEQGLHLAALYRAVPYILQHRRPGLARAREEILAALLDLIR